MSPASSNTLDGAGSHHDRHPPGRFHRQRRGRVAVHQLLPPGGLHPLARRGLRARAVARGARRHGADPHQQPHVRRGPSPHLPGHGHRERLRQAGHGRALRAGPGRGAPRSLQEMVDEGVRRAYLDPDNKLRATLLADPAGKRINTKDNTPAVVSVEVVRGATVEVTVAAKGGGSEAKSKFVMLNPNDSVVDWVLKTVPTMGAGWCPPGILGHRHRRHGGEGHAAGQAIAHGPHRHSGPHRARRQDHRRKTARRALRQGEPPRHRRAGTGRPDDGARREGGRLRPRTRPICPWP